MIKYPAIENVSRNRMNRIATVEPGKVPPFTIISKGKKKPKVKPETTDQDVPFAKWIMPPQPEGYIKGRIHDFF